MACSSSSCRGRPRRAPRERAARASRRSTCASPPSGSRRPSTGYGSKCGPRRGASRPPAALAPADIAQPIRTILRPQKNARVMLAEVQRVDLASRSLDTAVGRVPYDYLILAPGAVDEYFGHEEWRRFAPGMKEVEEATFIPSRLLRSFGIAELEAGQKERAAHLTFIIVRGGPTGRRAAGGHQEPPVG